MTKLEAITVDSVISGISPDGPVTVKHVRLFGDQAMEVTFIDGEGKPGNRLLFRDEEENLEIVEQARPLSFTADAAQFRLVSEAQRIRLGYLFDPLIAVHTSAVDPLPHQITAVYTEMLKRQPLRFLLADDPGAGKTIMAGLFIKELIIRGDVSRCLIVAPGGLVEQWQDELDQRFNLPFEIMTNDALEAARTGNWFLEHNLCLCRLDKLSRNEDLQEKLGAVDWDLVVVDEAHKMSASYFGYEIKYTKRYRLGQYLSEHSRQLLLLTATPHNGKEQDFQLFMALLDGDRFEGRFRDGVHSTDSGDLIRRMVKEQLVTMEGKPLFPERFAYTVQFELSSEEAALYAAVTDYVREEFNRADALENEGRKGTVGFALLILQRRLASSPEAIYQSLRRRRERLEKRLREEKLLKRGREVRFDEVEAFQELTEEDFDDLEEAPEGELEEAEERILDLATAALTISELEAEIGILKKLEKQAHRLRLSGQDTKWRKLSETLQDNPNMLDNHGRRRKLVIFTEHRDTLRYLEDRLSTFLGDPECIVTIHGQVPREKRRRIQEAFTSNPEIRILLATDAAGEGINLQRAHLMVNYDLPWNPNRIEQRFGRIHRIGQKEVCHLWNLVAENTREGEVFLRLLMKLEQERKTLGGAVFDVLGKIFRGSPLKALLIDAIRYGERPDVKAKLNEVIDRELDVEHLRGLIEERSLARDSLDLSQVRLIREEMEKAEVRKLQPFYIRAYFTEAFRQLGGRMASREKKRFEIRHVPLEIRRRDRLIGRHAPVLKNYERITFDKEHLTVDGKPPAILLSPGHPLMEAVTDLVLEKNRNLLREGSVLLDGTDPGEEPRVLLYLEHAITDARKDAKRDPRLVSRQLQFVEIDKEGAVSMAGCAPYLDYHVPTEEQLQVVQPLLREKWLQRDFEQEAVAFAVGRLVPTHLQEVKERREDLILKTMRQVKERLTLEIAYWDHRANELKVREEAGKSRSRLNSKKTRQRADRLAERLKNRLSELELERQIIAKPPTVLGGALIIPVGLLNRLEGKPRQKPPLFAAETREVERLAMEMVLETEKELGFEPRDVGSEKIGYDIESRDPESGRLRFIEVKGRVAGADTVTVTKNEILTSLNKPDAFILALVEVENGVARPPRYVRKPFHQPPDFAETSKNLNLKKLLTVSEEPGGYNERNLT